MIGFKPDNPSQNEAGTMEGERKTTEATRQGPVPPKPAKRSNKPIPVKAAVVRRKAEGKSDRQISREMTGAGMPIDRETVSVICNEPEIRAILEGAVRASQGIVAKALPAISEMVVKDTVSERDRELGARIMEKTGVLRESAGDQLCQIDVNLHQLAINLLGLGEKKRGPSDTITVEAKSSNDAATAEAGVAPADEISKRAEPPPSPEPSAIPERYRDLEKWKEQYYVERPWLRKLQS